MAIANATLLLLLLITDAPDTTICNADGQDTFNAGGIKFQLIKAMRKWRIIFNGLAKRTQNGEVGQSNLFTYP